MFFLDFIRVHIQVVDMGSFNHTYLKLRIYKWTCVFIAHQGKQTTWSTKFCVGKHWRDSDEKRYSDRAFGMNAAEMEKHVLREDETTRGLSLIHI